MRYAVRFSRTEHRTLIGFLKTLPPESVSVLSTLILANLPEAKAKAFIKKLTNPRE